MAFWRVGQDGVMVAVKVQPKSRRPGLHGRLPGPDGERLRIGVAEAAENGRANRSACALLARALDLPAGAVAIVSGATAQEKTFRIAADPAAILPRLEAL